MVVIGYGPSPDAHIPLQYHAIRVIMCTPSCRSQSTNFRAQPAKLAYPTFIHRTDIPKQIEDRNGNGRVHPLMHKVAKIVTCLSARTDRPGVKIKNHGLGQYGAKP